MCLCTQKAPHASFLLSKQAYLLTFDPSDGAKRSTEPFGLEQLRIERLTPKSPPLNGE